ncbi:predicted protein [Nematostella vectensis]|uniref:G-protein coupled receptors family 1 profile domain-containing protein n=1 Tax=Nematostella vectensis TaxID=45351 RepID=A7S6M9_NEMVE|nr:beta-4C adrenergic receptor [Nematostella vectensis]EDO40645.1 predicted protein [Nematostella vectensis]|eukprot:XP_001632708.1 predicted protein [Nematostella vectensis]
MVTGLAHVISLTILSGLSAVVGVLGNLAVLVIVVKNTDFQRGMNIFIASLSLVDLVVCSVVQPVFIYLLYKDSESPLLQDFEDDVFGILVQCSFNLLFAIAVNRLVEITYPFRYNALATKTRLLVIICLLCVISVIQGLVFNTDKYESTEAIIQYLTILAVLMIYVRVYRVAVRHKNAIQAQFTSVAYNKSIIGSRLMREHKASTTTAIITVTFVVCYVPFSATNLTDPANEKVKLWTVALVNFSSAINAYIYALRSEKFKVAVKKELKEICCSKA